MRAPSDQAAAQMGDHRMSFRDVRLGMLLPERTFRPTPEDLIRFAGAADDYSYQHWDADRMRALGFASPIVHGWLTVSYMCRAARAAFARSTRIGALEIRHHRPAFPGLILCGGKVEEIGDGDILLAMWAEDGDRQRLSSGTIRLRGADAYGTM